MKRPHTFAQNRQMRAENPCYTVDTGSEALRKSRFNWKHESLRVRIALGFVFLVAMADKIRSELPELPGPSELPNTLLDALGQALQTRPWNVAGILALLILWLFLQILDRRLGDYRPLGDYWQHSISWIALYLFMAYWELVKLMAPSISKVSVDWLVWAYLVLSLIIYYSLWVVALGPGKLNDELNWRLIDYATAMIALSVAILFTQLQGQSGAWRWLTTIFLLLASTAGILASHFGDFPAPKKYRWVRWVVLSAVAIEVFLLSFSRQMVNADDSVLNFFVHLEEMVFGIGLIALIADSALRFNSRRSHQHLDEINYRYRRRR